MIIASIKLRAELAFSFLDYKNNILRYFDFIGEFYVIDE